MKEVKDHLNRSVAYPFPPKRIVSLVPAITETMFYLGLKESIVGRTHFCVFPEEVKEVQGVGGTKTVKMDWIHELEPDLIIAEKEENTKEIVESLEAYYPVFVFEIQTIQSVLRMIEDVGKLTDHQRSSANLIHAIQVGMEELPQANGKRIAYVIWRKPYMVVGKDTYIQSLLESMGFINPFTSFSGRYPEVTAEDLQHAQLDYLFLATEPYPYREKHLPEFQEMLPEVNTMIISGEMFWYGAKMLEATAYFKDKFKEFS